MDDNVVWIILTWLIVCPAAVVEGGADWKSLIPADETDVLVWPSVVFSSSTL